MTNGAIEFHDISRGVRKNSFNHEWKLSLIIILTALFLVNSSVVSAQSGFASRVGGTGSDEGTRITLDDSGNIYTTGVFEGTVDFDPGLDTFDLTSNGSSDIFISKFDASGVFLWAKAVGGTGIDQSSGIAVDATENVYFTGSFEVTADFDPGIGTFELTSAGGSDIFVSKLSPSGSLLWAMVIGGTANDQATGIAMDTSGNVLTTGSFEDTVDFDPGSDAFTITSAGNSDIFISMLNNSGGFVWAKSMGGTGIDLASGIATDISGSVHTTGTYEGTADFDPSSVVFNLSDTNGNMYISKLNTSGEFIWAKAVGGTGTDHASGIAVDTSGNVYTTGYFLDTADFNPGIDIFNLNAIGGRDIFVCTLDSDGLFRWASAFGGSADDAGISIHVDPSGIVYAVGTYEDTADFDPGPEEFSLTSAGLKDACIIKLDAVGGLDWGKSIGGAGNDRALGIVSDPSERIYTTGSFEGIADFDPGADILLLTSAGLNDIFLSLLSRTGTVPLVGDANLDGVVDRTDALWMVQFEIGVRTGLSIETSDLNGDGLINSTDALWAAQIEAGLRAQP